MRILTIATLIMITLVVAGCCSQYDRAERNACLKAWYGLEPDPENPDVYKSGFDLWKDEAFGPDSGWQKTWTRMFGSEKEKEKLRQREENQSTDRPASKYRYR